MSTKRILLYKRKIDTHTINLSETQFICFGDYDGMDIFDIKDNSDGSFMNLREYPTENPKVNSADAITQEYNIFRPKDESYPDKEANFWKDSKPILATSFISLSHESKITPDQLVSFEMGKDCAIAYFSIDLGEIILFIKQDTYKECDDFLTDLRYCHVLEPKITYSYTITSIPSYKTMLYKDELLKVYPESLVKVTLSISSICHDGQTRNSKKFIDDLEAVIGKGKIETTSILGNYDIHVAIKDIVFGELISLYKTGEILSHTNETYKNTIYSCITRIHVDGSTNKEAVMTDYKVQPNCLMEEIICVEKWLKNPCGLNQTQEYITKTLHKILWSLNQANKTRLGRPVFNLLCAHIKLFKTLYTMYKDKLLNLSDDSDIEYINVFLKSLFTIISATNNATLDLFQNIEMNIYNTPIRILIFYSAFIDKVKEVFSGEETTEYQFLLLPEIATQIETRTLFHKVRDFNDDAIVLIRATDQVLFSDTFLFSLTHEIAHTVGNKTRCREIRGDYFSQILHFVICESLLKTVKAKFAFDDNASEALYRHILKHLKDGVNKKAKTKELKSNYHDDQEDHYVNLISDVINDDFSYVIDSIKAEIFSYLCTISDMNTLRNLYDILEIPKRKKITKSEVIHTIMSSVDDDFKYIALLFLNATGNRDTKYLDASVIPPVSAVAAYFLSLTREVYADLIAILTLRPLIKTYITLLSQVDISLIDTPIFITRIKVVLYVLYEKDSGYKTEWDDLCEKSNQEVLPLDFNNLKTEDDFDQTNEKFKTIIRHMLKLNGHSPASENGENTSNANYWYVNSLSLEKALYQYTKKCYDLYIHHITDPEINLKQQELTKLFKTIQNSHNLLEGIFNQNYS